MYPTPRHHGYHGRYPPIPPKLLRPDVALPLYANFDFAANVSPLTFYRGQTACEAGPSAHMTMYLHVARILHCPKCDFVGRIPLPLSISTHCLILPNIVSLEFRRKTTIVFSSSPLPPSNSAWLTTNYPRLYDKIKISAWQGRPYPYDQILPVNPPCDDKCEPTRFLLPPFPLLPSPFLPCASTRLNRTIQDLKATMKRFDP